MTNEIRTWFITGVSTGFGRELAHVALERGDRVAGTLRKPEQLAEFEALAPGRALAFLLDVTDQHGIQTTVKQVIGALGHIDVLVNNAGYGLIGALEEVSDAQIRSQFAVNTFGALDVMRAVLPHMRERQSGHILNISSVGGAVAFPGVGIYNASKFALEALSEALAGEIEHLGIKVTIIEPGAFRTDWAGRSLQTGEGIDDYAVSAGARRRAIQDEVDGKQPGDPRKAAEAMVDMVEMDNPPLRLAMGNDAVDAIRNKLTRQLEELTTYEHIARSLTFDISLMSAVKGQ